jgi:signal transduction histidine kinase
MVNNKKLKQKLLIFFVSAFLTLVLARFSLPIDFLAREYIIWSLIFIVMVARVMEMPYVIVASSVAFTLPFCVDMKWSSTNFIRGMLFFVWIMLIGLFSYRLRRKNGQVEGISIYIALMISIIIFAMVHFWGYQQIAALRIFTDYKYLVVSKILIRVDFYCTTFNCIMILLISDVLLELPVIRKIYYQKKLEYSEYANQYFVITVILSFVFLMLDLLIDKIYSKSMGLHLSFISISSGEKLKLFILIIIAAGVSKVIILSKRTRLANLRKIEEDEQQIQSLLYEMSSLNKQLEQQVYTRTIELNQAYADMESYTYTVSHELKTPVREIDLYAEFIEEDNIDRLLPESVKDIKSIRMTCQNIINLVENLMGYSKVGYKVLNFERIDMYELIKHCFEEIAKTVSDRTIKLELEEIPEILGDNFLMKRLVFNIISNSVKFTREISDAKIVIYSSEENDMIKYYFKDNGVGFDMKYASHIFGVFDRVHNESDYEGNGIGLATVQKITNRMGGSVEIEGKINEGCIVIVGLPKKI